MTLQQIYDTSVAHIRRQRKPAYNRKRSMCSYRTLDSNGKTMLSCGVGCLFPDSAYNRGMEGATIDYLLGAFQNNTLRQALTRTHNKHTLLARALDAAGIPCNEATLALLAQLQMAHDSAQLYDQRFMEHFNLSVEDIAHEFKLKHTEDQHV